MAASIRVGWDSLFTGRRVLELGAATGALTIFLRARGVDIVSSDIADDVVTENVRVNHELNNSALAHIPHTWGTDTTALTAAGPFHIVLGSDLLAYEDSFAALADTLSAVLPPRSSALFVDGEFIMCWKRRHVRKTEDAFFDRLKAADFAVTELRNKIYRIRRR